jgi:hypothetical protein
VRRQPSATVDARKLAERSTASYRTAKTIAQTQPQRNEEFKVQCIYEIRFEVTWESLQPGTWTEQVLKVLSEEDAQAGVDKARQAALAQHRLDDNGRENKCSGFRLWGVTVIAQANL